MQRVKIHFKKKKFELNLGRTLQFWLLSVGPSWLLAKGFISDLTYNGYWIFVIK